MSALYFWIGVMGLGLAYIWFYRWSRREPKPKKKRPVRQVTVEQQLAFEKRYYGRLVAQVPKLGLSREEEQHLLMELKRTYLQRIKGLMS